MVLKRRIEGDVGMIAPGAVLCCIGGGKLKYEPEGEVGKQQNVALQF